VAPIVTNHTYINQNEHKAQQLHTVRLFLDGDYLEKHARRRVRKPEFDFSDYVLHHFSKVVQISGGIDNEISDLLAALRREAERDALGSRHRVRSICTDLIVAVSRKLEVSKHGLPSVHGTSASHLVVGVKEYILKHFAGDLKLGEIAWHVGKGEEHLARVFKRETGETVFSYVREVRINRARTLILDPSLTMSEIAQRCGFHSLSFFSRTFRQITGMAPSSYRRHMGAVLSAPIK
jgi:AraC-like DNA-binding protein